VWAPGIGLQALALQSCHWNVTRAGSALQVGAVA
jgi:hypothetical protein